MKKLISLLCFILLLVGLIIGQNYYNKNLGQISKIQRQQISSISREFRKDDQMNKTKVIFIFLLYGIVHSIGPGHGKSIVSGILLSEDKKGAQIALFSGIISYSQGLTAFLMIKAFTLLGKNLLPQNAFKTEEGLRLISAGMILIIGVYILYKKLFSKHAHHKNSKSSLTTAVLLGLTPCFGTVNMLLFLGAMGLSHLQFIGALAISTGMFMTVASIGLFTTSFKSIGGNLGKHSIKILELLGPLIMIIYSFSIIKSNGVLNLFH